MRRHVTLLLGLICFTALAAAQDKPSTPRIFITESASWQLTLGSGGARPQSAEIMKTFNQRCPGVTINNRLELADYVVQLEHEGGKGVGQKDNKVSVFKKNGDLLYAGSTAVLGNAVKDSCEAILSDWRRNGTSTEFAPEATKNSIFPSVSVNMHRTASHAARSEAKVAFTMLDFVVEYLGTKNVSVVPAGSPSEYSLDLTVDRPFMKWLRVDIEVRNADGVVLWRDRAESGGGLTGEHGLRVTEERIQKLLDEKIGIENGLPVRQSPPKE
jgi:hypothetical protein